MQAPNIDAFLMQQQRKDNMKMMSEMTESCFEACVYNFRMRKLDAKEKACLYSCTDKYFRHAQRVGRIFQEQSMLMSGEQPPQ
jgi:mitochondrial import inner membrane translocase subunit TIM9